MINVKSSRVQRLIDQESELLMGMICMLTAIENRVRSNLVTLNQILLIPLWINYSTSKTTCLKNLPVYHLTEVMILQSLSNLE